MDKTVLVFIDSSGDPGRHVGGNTKFYVMCGLGLDASKWYDAYRGLDKLFEEFLPEMDLRYRPELKANDLRQGKGVFGKLDRERREELSDRVYQLILGLKPTAICIVVDKVEYYKRYPDEDPTSLKQRVFQYLVERFELYLSRTGSYGILVYDYEGRRDKALKELLERARTEGIYHKKQRKHWKFERIIETVFFISSEDSVGIQLADFVSRSVFECYEGNRCKNMEKLEKTFDRSPSGEVKGWGIKELP